MWFYVVDTSAETDCALVVAATALTGGVAAWAAWTSGWNPGTATLIALTMVLAVASVYARFLWRKDRAVAESRRLRAANLRAFR